MDTPEIDPARLALPLSEAIFTQRSIRRFRPEPIPAEDIRLILEAAAKTPSGGNRQPQRFLVVNDYPTASALSFLLMAFMLILVIIWARIAGTEALLGTEGERA